MAIASLVEKPGFAGSWGSSRLLENWDKWNAEHKHGGTATASPIKQSSGGFDVAGMPKETKGDIKGLAAKTGQKLHINGSTAGEFSKLASDHGHTVHHEEGKLIAKSASGENKGEFHSHGTTSKTTSGEIAKQAAGASVIAHDASKHANGGWDHELPGTLAQQGKSVDQYFLTHPKMENSNYAMQSSKSGNHGFASHFHQSAAETHDRQASEATDNTKGFHEKAATLHRVAAELHGQALKLKHGV